MSIQRSAIWACALAFGGCLSNDLEPQPVTTETAQEVLGFPEDGDLFADAFAVGDFDGDGFQDLAVGAPGEAVGATPHTGAVFIYRGSSNGLFAWKSIGELDLAPSFAGGGDQFGIALAAADFDGDGIDDLVIGAPHGRAQTSSGVHGGVIYVLWGGNGGPNLTGALTLDQNSATGSTSEDGDGFGSTLAVGDLDGNGRPDIAIGVPNETVNGFHYGWVNTLTSNGHARSFSNYGGVTSVDRLEGIGFTKSIAITDLDDDGRGDLIVGAPFDQQPYNETFPGSVYIYRSTGSGFAAGFAIGESGSGADAPAPGDRFGWSLAVGQFDNARFTATGHENHVKNELVVGAPLKDNPANSGRVFLFRPTIGNGLGMQQADMIGQNRVPDDSNGFLDLFGFALAANDIDGDGLTDLVVGAPNKTVIGEFGAVVTYFGSVTGLRGDQLLAWPAASNNGTFEVPADSDAFGTTVAVGRWDHVNGADVIGGMPNRRLQGTNAFNTGAYIEYRRTSTGAQQLRQYWDESTQ